MVLSRGKRQSQSNPSRWWHRPFRLLNSWHLVCILSILSTYLLVTNLRLQQRHSETFHTEEEFLPAISHFVNRSDKNKMMDPQNSNTLTFKRNENKNRQQEEDDINTNLLISNSNNTNTQRHQQQQQQHKTKCALLFFGIPRCFRFNALPSIRKYILTTNPTCDVFLHTYNISSVSIQRNNERGDLEPNDTYRLTENVVMETMDQFHSKRNLDEFRPYHFENWGPCCESTDNMIMQWHSIDAVWNLMVQYETSKMTPPPPLRESNQIPGGAKNESVPYRYYDRIGLFRSDVLYLHPIDINDGDAIVPDFLWKSTKPIMVNDRMFYGKREFAEVWAVKRFEYAKDYVKRKRRKSLQSERFLKALLEEYNVPYENRDICFWRLRANKEVMVEDCRVQGYRAEEHVKLLKGLIAQRRKPRDKGVDCSIYDSEPKLLAHHEANGFRTKSFRIHLQRLRIPSTSDPGSI